jgi:hypothetical protein
MAREDRSMKAFLAACAAAIVLAVIGAYALDSYQRPAEVAFTTTGARI